MTIDEASIRQLRDRGALLGTSNADEWERLLKKHGMGQLCWAIGEARTKLGRQPSWEQVAAKLPSTAKAVVEISEPAPSPPAAPIHIAKPPAAPEVDDQVVEQLEHEPAPAPPPQPATERKVARSAPAGPDATTSGAAQPQPAPERAVKPRRARQKPDPRPPGPTPPPAAPEACAAPCSACARLQAELAKALIESDELGAEISRLQAIATRPSIPEQLRAELEALREQLLEARAALAAIPKA